MQYPQITFWFQPTPDRLEKLLRDQIKEYGKEKTFKKSESYIFTYAGGYTTLEHDNINVLLSCTDNKLMIIEWPQTRNNYGTFNSEKKIIEDLDLYPLILELAQYLENKFKPSHYPTNNTRHNQ